MLHLEFNSESENEGIARIVTSAYIMRFDPDMEEMEDVKTAVSEAVTNAIIHGYDGMTGKEQNQVYIHCLLNRDVLQVEVIDEGKGIEDVEKAMEPMYTTKPDMDRSGMGFAFMEAFMDELAVESGEGKGTLVRMKKTIYSAYDGR